MKIPSLPGLPSIPDLQHTVVGTHFNQLVRSAEDQGRVVLITLLTSLCTILPVGYHIVVLNVPEKIIQREFNESMYNVFNVALTANGLSLWWSITVASQSLGALLGCLLVLPLDRKYGAKVSMMSINNAILIAGSVTMACAKFCSFAPALLIGRTLTGVYTGIACAMVPIFIQEVAPKKIKGSLCCFIHIAVCVGTALAAILSLDFMLGGESTWGVLLLLPAFFGALQIIAAFFIPDTPNNLLQKGAYTEAVRSIRFYYDIDLDDDDEAIQEYWGLVQETPDQMSFWAAMSFPNIRNGILLGMVVSATQIFSGSMVTISYSTSMFNAVLFVDGLVPFLPAIGSIVSIILTLPALQLVESSGRRPLLLNTLLLCLVADLLFMIFSLLSSSTNDWASWGFTASFLLYGIGYNIGTGPVAYFLPAELVPPEAVTASLGAAVAVNWICTTITTFTYYPLNIAIGGWSYLIFVLPSLLFLMILWRFLPETKFYYMDPVAENVTFCDIAPAPYGTFEKDGR